MSDFYAALLAHGLRPRTAPSPDGRWRRCPTESHPSKKNGAYKLAVDGRFGVFQDWATDPEAITWRAERSVHLPAIDTQRLARDAERIHAERAAAIQGARTFYQNCSPLIGGHPYLGAHGLGMDGCRGLRVDARGALVVPMLRGGKVTSVQKIDQAGDKRFWPGAPTTSCSYEVERRGATLTVLAEGLATGLAIYAAVPTARVVVAFNAGNLIRVAEIMHRGGLMVVAADNDHATAARIGRNPGVEAAEAAAAALGCGVAVPEGIAGTDWCDLRAEKVAGRLERRIYSSHVTEHQIRRAVDAEISDAMMRAARFVARAS